MYCSDCGFGAKRHIDRCGICGGPLYYLPPEVLGMMRGAAGMVVAVVAGIGVDSTDSWWVKALYVAGALIAVIGILGAEAVAKRAVQYVRRRQ